MQENEFEKQVKKMMDSFKLSPSDSVWEKVNRRINGDKRKKRPFIFLLFMSLLIAGYFMFYASQRQIQKAQNTTATRNVKTGKSGINSLIDPGISATKKYSEGNKLNTSIIPKKSDLPQVERLNNKSKGPANTITSSIRPKESKPVRQELIQQNRNNNDVQQRIETQIINPKDSLFSASGKLSQNYPVNKQTNAVNDSTKLLNSTDSITENRNLSKPDSIQLSQARESNSLLQPVENPVKKKYIIPKWQWGIVAFYGRSNVIESLVDFNKSASGQYVNNPGSVSGNTDTTFHNKDPYSASDAYQFGVVAQKKIIRNGFLSAGLSHIHLSVNSEVGKTNDSTIAVSGSFYRISQYFQAGSLQTFTSRYNFIELPVYFQQDFFADKKFSFSYNAGVSMRQLISSDALIYDPYNHVYFFKDDLLRKTQFQFLAGLSLKINIGRTSIYAGPQFAYGLTDLFKTNNSSFHMINYGLQVGAMFHKK